MMSSDEREQHRPPGQVLPLGVEESAASGFAQGRFCAVALKLLAIGYWLLAIGYWLLAIGYWGMLSASQTSLDIDCVKYTAVGGKDRVRPTVAFFPAAKRIVQ